MFASPSGIEPEDFACPKLIIRVLDSEVQVDSTVLIPSVSSVFLHCFS